MKTFLAACFTFLASALLLSAAEPSPQARTASPWRWRSTRTSPPRTTS